MARRPKKAAKAQRGKVGEEGYVPRKEFGRLNKAGIPQIDFESLELFKKQLGQARWGKVKFEAKNAPFKRGSPVSST